MPVPMMAPTPSMTSCAGPEHALKSAAAPVPPSCSCVICSMGLVAKMDMPQRGRRRRRSLEPGLKRLEETLKLFLSLTRCGT